MEEMWMILKNDYNMTTKTILFPIYHYILQVSITDTALSYILTKMTQLGNTRNMN